jgi:hypothetical protein
MEEAVSFRRYVISCYCRREAASSYIPYDCRDYAILGSILS